VPRGERVKMPSAHHDSVPTPGELLPALVDDTGFIEVASDCFVGRELSLEAQQPVEADDTTFAEVPCSNETKVSRTYEIKAWC
jgi:hypothetical protein